MDTNIVFFISPTFCERVWQESERFIMLNHSTWQLAQCAKELGNMQSAPKNFPTESDTMVLIRFEQTQNCGMYMNSTDEDGIVCFLK